MKKFQKGDLVVVESLRITKSRHGTNSAMEKMVDLEFEVDDLGTDHSDNNEVHFKHNHSTWSFAPEDLILAESISDVVSDAMATEPIMFDPNELVT